MNASIVRGVIAIGIVVAVPCLVVNACVPRLHECETAPAHGDYLREDGTSYILRTTCP